MKMTNVINFSSFLFIRNLLKTEYNIQFDEIFATLYFNQKIFDQKYEISISFNNLIKTFIFYAQT